MQAYVEKVRDDNSLSVLLYQPLPNKYINISGMLVKRGHAISTGLTSAQAEYLSRLDIGPKENDLVISQSETESIYSSVSGVSKTSQKNKKKPRERKASTRSSVQEHTKSSVQSVSSSQDVPNRQSNDLDSRVKIETIKVVSPSEIYVISPNIQKQIKKLIKDMTEYYTPNNEEEEDREWSVGDLCAVEKKDGFWYRGVIVGISHRMYKVYIKDIVEVVDVDKCKVRTLELNFRTVPDGSIKVHLTGLKVPAGLKVWPSSTNDFLRAQMEQSEALYIEKLDKVLADSIPVRLWRKTQKQGGPLDPEIDEWYDVNMSLVNLGFALRDQLVLSNGEEDSNERVENWLINSFEPVHEINHEENSRLLGAAKAPYVSDLEKSEVTSVKSMKPARESTRNRSNRGRFVSQRAMYIPPTIGPPQPEAITEWKPATPFQSLSFEAQPSYVDYDCNIYLQDIDNVAGTLELLEKAFLSLFENSDRRPYEEVYGEGQICVAFYGITKKWYRGKVLKVNQKDIDVLFVDYGNIEKMQPEFLRKQVTMCHIPIQCHRCRTEGIIPISPDGKWPEKVLDFIHCSVVEKRCAVNLKPPANDSDDYTILDLKLPGSIDLWETLLSMHYATYIIDCERAGDEDDEIIADNEIQQVFYNSDPPVLLPPVDPACRSPHSPGNNDVNHLQLLMNNSWYDQVMEEEVNPARPMLRYRELLLPDGISEFYVTVASVVCDNSMQAVKVIIKQCDDPEIEDFVKTFSNLEATIEAEADSLPFLKKPVEGLVCLGCYTEDNSWYRAVIVKVFEDCDIVTVDYVDYGNSEEISIARLKEIKPEWVQVPMQAFQVRLNRVVEGPYYESNKCSDALFSCFMDQPYLVTIEERFPIMSVEIFNKDGELAYKPLLKSGLLTKL